MKSDLGVSLLLEVADNTLPNEIAVSDDLEDLVVILADQGQLKAVLCRVDGDSARFSRSVKAVDDLALDAGEVDRLFERFDDTVITVSRSARVGSIPVCLYTPLRQGVFDVVQGCVDEDTAVVPSSRLNPNSLVNQHALTKRFVGDCNSCPD